LALDSVDASTTAELFDTEFRRPNRDREGDEFVIDLRTGRKASSPLPRHVDRLAE
jgi:hypothetical protein